MRKSKIYLYSKDELQKLANSSESYADILRKIGLCPYGGNPKTLKRVFREYGVDESVMNKNRSELFARWASATHKKTMTRTEDILSGKAKFQSSKLLKRLIREGYKENKCEICGLSEWQGKPLTLNLHHIDGNRNNNSLGNLQVLCPNCHSQTDNYAGKSNRR